MRGGRSIALAVLNVGARSGWVVITTQLLMPRKRPGTDSTERWVDPGACLGGLGKILSPPGFDTRPDSCYTDVAVLPTHLMVLLI
jgi:hypothetical protein